MSSDSDTQNKPEDTDESANDTADETDHSPLHQPTPVKASSSTDTDAGTTDEIEPLLVEQSTTDEPTTNKPVLVDTDSRVAFDAATISPNITQVPPDLNEPDIAEAENTPFEPHEVIAPPPTEDIAETSDTDTNTNTNTNTDTTDTGTEKDKITRAIKNFINGEGDDTQSATTKQSSAGKQFHDRRDVIKALTALQTTHKPRYIPGETQIRTDDFKHALLNSMAKMGNTNLSKSLNAIDGRTIDFVEMLFGAFLRDENISVALKSLLLELQIPLIKVSMLDQMFFQNTNHPARNMLDTIAHLGIGIEDSENTLFKTMQLIVDQLQSTFEQNLSSFNTSLTALNRLTAIEKDKTGQQEEVTQKAIFKEHARQIVLNELQRHTYKKIIQKDLKPLILKQWSALMFQRFIKYGKESSQWNEIVTLLKHIIYSVQPITSSEQWVLLSNDSDILISDVSAQLNTTRLSPGSIDASLAALKEIHARLLETSEFFQETPDYHLAEKSLDEMMLESEEEIPDTGDPPHIQISRLPRDVKQGVWFEIYNGEDKALRRVKLSVILFDEAKLIFVDRHGNKVIEKLADEFVNELNDQKSKIIADHSIFNHALGQVINSIIR